MGVIKRHLADVNDRIRDDKSVINALGMLEKMRWYCSDIIAYGQSFETYTES